MANLDVSAFDAFLKEIYPPTEVELIAATDSPTLAMMPKADDFGGDTVVVPILYGNPAGRSATFADAISNANTTKQTKFVLTERKKDYNVVNIEAEVIMATAKGHYSFAEAKALQIRGKLEELGKSLSLALFRDGTGEIGTVSAIGNGSGTNTQITLDVAADTHSFSVGQVLNIRNQSDSFNILQASGGGDLNVTVVGIDHDNGYVDTDSNLSTAGASAVAALDTLITDGDLTDADTDKRLVGFGGWLPLTAPTSGDSHFSVDRSVNVGALAGHRVDNTGRTLLENGQELAMKIGRFGGKPDCWVMNPEAGLQLAAQTGSKVERKDGGRAGVGFSGFDLVGFMTSPITVVFDWSCPTNRAYMLQKNTWKIHHLGGLPHIVRDDGLMVQRSSSFDGVECRSRYYAELACRAPGYNGVMSVATS